MVARKLKAELVELYEPAIGICREPADWKNAPTDGNYQITSCPMNHQKSEVSSRPALTERRRVLRVTLGPATANL